jgi:monoamine oxidase
MEDVDVVIIGACSAGLAATKIPQAAGLSFKLLEAVDRIGGRAWTRDQHFGVPSTSAAPGTYWGWPA